MKAVEITVEITCDSCGKDMPERVDVVKRWAAVEMAAGELDDVHSGWGCRVLCLDCLSRFDEMTRLTRFAQLPREELPDDTDVLPDGAFEELSRYRSCECARLTKEQKQKLLAMNHDQRVDEFMALMRMGVIQ